MKYILFFLLFWIFVSFVSHSVNINCVVNKDDKWYIKLGKLIVLAPHWALTRAYNEIHKRIKKP